MDSTVADTSADTSSPPDTSTGDTSPGDTAPPTDTSPGDTGPVTDTGADTAPNPDAATFTVGGTVTGLTGTLVLQNNGADNLSLTANGAFNFASPAPSGAAYAVTVLTQPAGENCTVAMATGTVAGANVTTVDVTCTAQMGGEGGVDGSFDAGGPFTIGGSISGLAGTVVLQDNLGDNLSLTANGNFTFLTPVAAGGAYSVTVFTQPGMPVQTCVVSGGTGTASANVTSVAVTCTTAKFTVGGTVTGLSAGGSLVLQDNLGDNLPISANGAFTFATSVASGAAYAVTVSTQPTTPPQTCTVTMGSGTVGAANVTNVAVSCGVVSFTIGGTVTGLAGAGPIVLQDNNGDNLNVTANGAFTFATPLAGGATYAVTVFTQPPGGQTCVVSAGTGTVGTSNVTSVVVNCSSATFTIGGKVSGLAPGDVVRLLDNGGDATFVSQNGNFAFPTPLANGAAYAVTVGSNPMAPIVETCTVTNGTGTVMAANVTTVVVTCVPNAFSLGGTVTGLLAGQTVKLVNNLVNPTSVTGPSGVAGQAFTFSQNVLSGASYQVTVAANPVGPYWEICTVANGTGTMGNAPVTNVAVTCTLGGNGTAGAFPGSGSINGAATTATGTAGTTAAAAPGASGLFNAGDVVLFHQSQGGTTGVWELNTVVSTTGAGVTLLQPLVNTYSAGAQVLKVPQYNGAMNVTGALTAPAWNGSTGGILAFMDNNAVTVTGTINMSGSGFRGGGFANTAANCDMHCQFGVQGESTLGAGTNGGNTVAALMNNGAGGGGGGQGQDCGMGAGGAYGAVGAIGGNNTGGTCSVGGGNSLGGVADGVADLSGLLLFGGGGGEAGYDEDGTYPGSGGNGGGIVLIFAQSVSVTSGTIVSNGGAGGNGTNGCPFAGGATGGGCGMGGGGGGAGGAIQIAATTLSLGANLVSSSGAGGGTCTCGANNSGAGSVGRVGVKVTGAVTGTTLPTFDLE